METSPQDLTTKLLRFIGAALYTNVAMYAARDIFGQSLFALTEQQKKEVNEKVDSFLSPAFENLSDKNLTPPVGVVVSGWMN
jgi:hypothetical protein